MDGIKQPGEISPVPKLVLGFIALLAVSIILLVIFLGPQLPDSGTGNTEFMQIPRVNKAEQEIVVSANKITLYVPKDGLDSGLTGNFVILPQDPNLYSYASAPEWSLPVVVDIQYRNEEGILYPGFTFSKPVRICFTLTPEQWKDFTQNPGDFQVQYFDNQKSPFRWLALPVATDPEGYELCTQTDHLSIYALAVKSKEEIPVTGPTLISTAISTAIPTLTNIINTPDDGRKREPEKAPLATAKPPQPTDPPVEPPPTDPPPTDPPVEPPPTDPPPTDPPVEPPPTDPPVEPPPTDPPVEPPPTEPPPIVLPPLELPGWLVP
jgi:hypothetical protein